MPSDDQDGRDDLREPFADVAGGDRAELLGGVQAVGVRVERVVEEVGAARREAEGDEGHERLGEVVPLVEHARRRPGPRTRGRSSSTASAGPCAAAIARSAGRTGTGERLARITDRACVCALGHSACGQATGGPAERRGWPRRLSPCPCPARSTRAPVTTGPPVCCTAGGPARTVRGRRPTARRTKRCRRSVSARAEAERGGELDALLIRLQRELFVVGAELATEPENRDRLQDGVTRVTTAMVAALEPVIDDVTDALRAAPGVRAPRRDPRRCRARRRAHRGAPGRARGRRRHHGRLAGGREPGGPVPQPPRRSRLHPRPLAGGRSTAPPASADPPAPAHCSPVHRPHPAPVTGGTRGHHPHRRRPARPMPSAPTCSSCPPAPTGRSAAQRRSCEQALGDTSPPSRCHRLRGQARPDRAGAGRRADPGRRGAARRRRRPRRRSPSTGCGAPARRSPARRRKVRTVATTLVDAAPTRWRRGRGAGGRRGRAARRLPVPRVQVAGHRRPPCARVTVLDGRAEVRRGVDRGAVVATAAAWARDHRQRAVADMQSPAQFVTSARRLLSGTGVRIDGAHRGPDPGPAPRWRRRGGAGLGPAAPLPQDLLRADAPGRRAPRARGQGCRLRLRRPVAQDRRRAWRR